MPTFAEHLAGVTDSHECAVLKARIFTDPESYGVDFTAQRIIRYKGWTLTVMDLFLGLEGQAIGLWLRLETSTGEQVDLDNPFYIFNPFYVDENGVENPARAFVCMITDALHDAAVKAGYEPPF